MHDRPGQRALRALARPRSLPRRLRASRCVQPAARPAGRRGNPLHRSPRHRAAVLAVEGLAVHRSLPAEQRAGRLGPPRLGVPGRGTHAAAHTDREWLVHSTIGNATRDRIPIEARVRRVRRVQLLLRVRRRTGNPLAIGPATGAVPAHRRLLRDAPALPAHPLSARRRRPRRAPGLPSRHRRHPRGSRRLLRIDLRRGCRGRPTTRHPGRDGTRPQHLGGVPHRSRAGSSAGEIHPVRRGHRHRHDRAATPGRRCRTSGVRRAVQRCRPGSDAARAARRRHSTRDRRAFARKTIAADPRDAKTRFAPRSTR